MPCALNIPDLAEFQCALIGTWKNDDKLVDPSTKLPLSFNVMPLPQVETQARAATSGSYGGFILKNFAFTETIRFNGTAAQNPQTVSVLAGAPNGGGTYTQLSRAVFYDQQVHFAEGPQGPTAGKTLGDVVHVENGAWLHLVSIKQGLGPYSLEKSGGPFVEGPLLPQPPNVSIAKQISVPHGNSVLALGSVDTFGKDKKGNPLMTLQGAPVIPDAFVPYPEPAGASVDPNVDPYQTLLNAADDYENPNVASTLNASAPLQQALTIVQPKSHMHWRVTTQPLFGGAGVVTNIPFEQRKSKVIGYAADYWLLSEDVYKLGGGSVNFKYLAYTQIILMEMQIYTGSGDPLSPANYRRYIFPHVTSNTVAKL